MVKIWSVVRSDKDYVDAAIENVRQFMGVPLRAGQALAERFPPHTTVVLRSEGIPNDYFEAGPMPVVSSKLKGVLDTFGVSAEFFSILLRRINGEVVSGNWYCLNVTALLDCLDREKSVFTRNKEFATNISRLVFTEAADNVSIALFRVAKTAPSLLCASDALAASTVKCGCSGIVLRSPGDS